MSLENRQQVTLKWVSGNTDHPDVADGVELKLFSSEVRETFGKDINYIQRPKTSGNHFEGPDTLAFDLLKDEHKWNVTAQIVGKEHTEDLFTLPSGARDSNNDGVVSDQNVSFSSFGDPNTSSNEWVLLGATKIKHDSETFKNSSGTTLTRGTDYNIDYNRGRIELFDTAATTISETYTISYTYNGENDNLARVIKRMAERGGNAVLTYDKNSYTTSSGEEGAQYMVQFDNVEWQASPSQPNLVEISIEARVALDRGT